MKILEKMLLFFSKAKLVSEDYYGNSYFLLKQTDSFGRQARYVKYFKKNNASSIPALWSGWLRYSIDTDELQSSIAKVKAPFIKLHQPNLTGTNGCYTPLNTMKERAKNTCIYQSWLNL
jgi:NADH:ubiquinone oxidoreductase subunit